jgi:hypothetical protein
MYSIELVWYDAIFIKASYCIVRYMACQVYA